MKMADEQCVDSCLGTDLDPESINALQLGDPVAIEMSEWFKALGDPTRIKIIYALLNKELCVHDISLVLSMGQSAVSHQLRYLRNVRMVKRRKAGKTVYYSLDDSHVEQIFGQTIQHLKHT